ncbi:MAG TPA: NUDIX hydrolase [Candidatus Corynebacterium avicola]|uniref:NUDIX hydrolase n=1 Tax=Candidatus Corynebacterium avicola TaxID=2838527 RepID=A0A9D1UM52_9CORY|nr:NUDIX hydrolase [Candidatus Corynebacterium avicola]
MTTHNGIGDLSTALASGNLNDSTGHVARIGSSPDKEFERPVFAAGAVLWRRTSPAGPGTAETAADGEIEVAVIHRPHYDDWSLPKGKVDKGESLPQTASREILEETGYSPTLGWLLGHVHYPVQKKTKVVYYWTAEVTEGEFVANDEVDVLEWVTPEEAAKRVSYDADRDVIAAALDVLALGCTRRVLYVRHAKAIDRDDWGQDDNLRPLTKKGYRQATSLTGVLNGYRPQAVASAEPERCKSTVEPLAEKLDLEVQVDPHLGDAVLEHSPRTVMEALVKATAAPVSVVCSQGDVMPTVINGLAQDAGIEVEDLRVKKGSVWVLHLGANDTLLGADYLASPLRLP